MYSNSILTEGIAIPCYFLFFRYLIEFCLHRRKNAFIACWFLSFLLVSTRKQMTVTIIMLIFGILYCFFKTANYLKGIALSFLCAVSILLCTFCLDLGYNYVLRGEMISHSGDTRFITTMAIYTAQRTDVQYIENKDIQNLFLEIYDICDEKGYLKNAAGKGWLNRVSHFGDNYDYIQINTMGPIVNHFSLEKCNGNLIAANEYGDQIMNMINHSIIPHNLPKIFGTFVDNFLSGLVTTVAQRNSILIWYSLAVYLFYIALLIWHCLTIRDSKVILLASFVLISIVCNVGLVSMVIFSQTRYTIYNMSLFYIGLLLLLQEPVCRISSHRRQRSSPH